MYYCQGVKVKLFNDVFQDETDSIAETDSDRDRDRDVKSAMEGGNIEREGAINLTHSRPSSVSGVSNSQHNDMEHEVSTFFLFSYILHSLHSIVYYVEITKLYVQNTQSCYYPQSNICCFLKPKNLSDRLL